MDFSLQSLAHLAVLGWGTLRLTVRKKTDIKALKGTIDNGCANSVENISLRHGGASVCILCAHGPEDVIEGEGLGLSLLEVEELYLLL